MWVEVGLFWVDVRWWGVCDKNEDYLLGKMIVEIVKMMMIGMKMLTKVKKRRKSQL